MASRKAVVAQLGIMAIGSILAAVNHSIALTIFATLMIGAVLAPLGTYYSLVLDTLAPPDKRPELFALLRTSQSIGVVLASALITFVSLSAALICVSALILMVTFAVSWSSFKPR
jgi:predicted MFS family arabinose efflux permease